jgi:tetratricopeptide (TPR) repeat protein
VAGRRADWEELLRKIGRNPEAADELFRGASLLSRAGKTKAAIAMYRDVLAVSPGDTDAMNNLALLLAAEAPDSDEALALLEEALRRVPDDPYVLASRGEVLYGRGEREAALADFQRSLDLLGADDQEAREQIMRWILRVE